MNSEKKSVAICVATYRRPRMLEECLYGIAEMCSAAGRGTDIGVVVIDNDIGMSAQYVVEHLRDTAAFPVYYRCEPRRGIPHARNAAVGTALEAGFGFIAFIDDDEFPGAAWLGELLRVQSAEDAPIVSGPVLMVLPEGAPSWIWRDQLLPRGRRFQTGTHRPRAATNNVLVDASVFDCADPWFDERFASGSDTELFKRLADNGCKIVWANDAVVFESVPVERTTLGWLTVRAYREGNGRTWRDFRGQGLGAFGTGMLRVPWCLARGIAKMGIGIGRGWPEAVKGWLLIAEGAGMLAGFTGHRFNEYETTTGS